MNTDMNVNILNEDPKIYTVDNMLTEEECEHFISISSGNLKRALVSGGKEGYVSQGRSGSNTWLAHNTDEITQRVGKKIAQHVQMPLENAEKFQIIYYGISQEYRKHYDSWDHDGSEKTFRNVKYGGARLRTALVYLNDVEEGGGTQMTKLGITVEAKKGRLLVFDNVYEGTHNKHLLSEHAGMPVIKGEKYAFNLWFRECNRNRLYSDFNPSYYNNTSLSIEDTNTFTKKDHFFTPIEMMSLVNDCIFKDTKYPSCWINLSKISGIVEKINPLLNIGNGKLEGANVILYKAGVSHGPFYDGYDLNTDKGRINAEKRGQRLYSITFVFTNEIELKFSKKGEKVKLKSGDLVYYKNFISDSNLSRDPTMEHIITNSTNNNSIVVNFYVREYAFGERSVSVSKSNMVEVNLENYRDTLKEVYSKIQNTQIEKLSSSLTHNSFKYNLGKLSNNIILPVAQFISLQSSILNEDLMNKSDGDFVFNEFTPIVLENVIKRDVLEKCQEYYKTNINAGKFTLGDRQSKRYKHHNEPISRFLHYEMLPLIEKIVGKDLRPTYTYLSAYVKDSDLPAHTDREDCQYTVSFLIDKPEDSSWSIYFHKKQQPVKFKGRYDFTPPISECISVDCEAGGMMMFCGQDHIHFREPLKDDYYNIVLLHYCEL